MNDTTLILLWVIFIRPSSVSDLNAKLVRGLVSTHVAGGVEGAAALETSLRGFQFCSQCWENPPKRSSPVLLWTTNWIKSGKTSGGFC